MAYLEADDRPAILEDCERVPEGRVVQVERGGISALIVDAQAVTQDPEVVPVHVEGMLLLSSPIGADATPSVIATCCEGTQITGCCNLRIGHAAQAASTLAQECMTMASQISYSSRARIS